MHPGADRQFPPVVRNGLKGILDRFYLLGPFNQEGKTSPCDALRTDYLRSFGGEKRLDAARFRRTAIPYVMGAGFSVNLLPLARASGSIMYALSVIKSPANQHALIRLGSDKGYKLFVNNKEVGHLDAHRGLAPDQNEHSVRLRKGDNLVLMKVEYVFGAYEFMLRLDAKQKVSQLFHVPEGYQAETLHFTDTDVRPTDFTQRLLYSSADYFAGLAESLRPEFAFTARNKREMSHWHSAFHRRLRTLLGPEPPRDDRPALILSEDDIGDGLVRQKIILRPYRNSDIPCYLLRPRKPKEQLPGIIALHGHGHGAYAVAGVTFGSKLLRDSIQTLNYDYGLKCAQRGSVVICPTARGFGERGLEFPHACDPFALKASLMGMNLLALNLFDFMRCIDYLQTLPFVDKKRIGCIGLSNGGTFAFHLAAVDRRIRATVVSGAVYSWRDQMWRRYACGNQVLHGILQYADIADITALIAPRALCVESGLYDCCCMLPSVRQAHSVLRRAWQIAGRPDRLSIDVFPGAHCFHGRRSIPFLQKHLTA